MCVVLCCVVYTCDVSHECRFRLRVESNYVTSVRACVCAVVVVVVYRACRFFSASSFLFLFPMHIYKCMDGWNVSERLNRFYFSVLLFVGLVGWLERKKREMKNDMGVSSRARMCLYSMVSKKKRNF